MENHEHKALNLSAGLGFVFAAVALVFLMLEIVESNNMSNRLDAIETRTAEPSPVPTPNLLELIATEVAK